MGLLSPLGTAKRPLPELYLRQATTQGSTVNEESYCYAMNPAWPEVVQRQCPRVLVVEYLSCS